MNAIEGGNMMNYTNIVLDLSSSGQPSAVCEYALRLARDHQAQVTAVNLGVPVSHDQSISAACSPGVQKPSGADEGDTAAMDEFARLARQHPDVVWRHFFGTGPLVDIIAAEGLYSDLIITRQFDPNDSPQCATYDAPVHIALLSGRPVLIVPRTDRFSSVGCRVVLAWNASPESARMVCAALPLLVHARSVDIVIITETAFPSDNDIVAPVTGDDIALYLARHRVKASITKVSAGELQVSEILLSVVADKGGDLLCVGAYGHARLRKLIVGATSRALMRNMMVPTLVAC